MVSAGTPVITNEFDSRDLFVSPTSYLSVPNVLKKQLYNNHFSFHCNRAAWLTATYGTFSGDWT
jgi:hypothetical protein